MRTSLPEDRIVKVIKIIETLQVEPMTLRAMQIKFHLTERTAYRVLHLIALVGYVIDKDDESRFYARKL